MKCKYLGAPPLENWTDTKSLSFVKSGLVIYLAGITFIAAYVAITF